MPIPSPLPATLHERLLETYVHLGRLGQHMIAAFDDGEYDEYNAWFRDFEAHLEGHLDFVDSTLLPRLARSEPAEAARRQERHAQFRERLTDLAIGIDLHYTRASAIKVLVAQVDAHLLREMEVFSRWADRTLSTGRLAWMVQRYPI